MTVPATLPAPRSNLTQSGISSWVDDVAAADIIVALGDFTGGASEDLFTLTSHGLVDGDVLYSLAQSAIGAITGGDLTRCVVEQLDANTFQCETDAGATIENTADGTVVFLKTPHPRTAEAVYGRIIYGGNDFTGGTVEDMVTTANFQGVQDGDTLKLLYKSAAGVAAVAADATAYVKTPVSTVSATGSTAYFQTSLTSGGAVADTTADGTLVFLKTS
jgi:hypothetical protein